MEVVDHPRALRGGGEVEWPSWCTQVAAAFAAVIAGLTPFTHRDGPTSAAEVTLLALALLPWLVEASGRSLPRPLFAALALLPPAALNVAGPAFLSLAHHDAQLSLMLAVLAVGQLAATSEPRAAVLYAGAALLIPLGRFGTHPGFDEWVFWAVGMFLAAAGGMGLRRQQLLLGQLRAAQHALADEAALQERRRIAREVHDVIAHSLAVSMLHLTAARLAVSRRTPDAEEALAEAERLGRQALNDVRRTVGLLHDEVGHPTALALPSGGDIPGLVASYAAAGVDVRFDSTVDLAVLSPAGGLALYRAVQEGLSNVVKHAPGATVTVQLSQQADRVVAEIRNDTASAPAGPCTIPGMGLRGMRERVEALGGSVVAGPQDGGWTTSCAIPV